MARKSGPIGRVRNIRNGDLSAIPSPYPILWIPKIVSWTASTLNIRFIVFVVDFQNVNSAVSIKSVPQFLIDSYFAPGTVSVVSTTPLEIQLTYPDPEIGVGSDIVLAQWSEALRGINGEWLTPALMRVV